MIHEQNFQEVTSVLFIKDYNTKDLLNLASTINNELKVFDGAPFILPLNNNDAPPEVPRIMLKNKNESILLQVSLERATLIIKGDIEDKLETSAKLTNVLSQVFIEKLKWTINRIGRIAAIKVKLDDSPLSFIKGKYLAEDKLNDSLQIQLNWLKRKDWDNDQINCWIRTDTGLQLNKPDLLIIVDVNLIINPDRIVSSITADNFINLSNEMIKKAIEEILF